jgi:aspartyl aminopeptidase
VSDAVLSRFLEFLDRSPTPWHAVRTAAERFEAAGFTRIDERDVPGKMAPGAKHYLARAGTLVAFRVGSRSPAEAGFRITSAHTDSPNLRLKPQPVQKGNGYVRLGVEVYGGVMLATWTDRDLGLAGQVFLRDGKGQKSVLVEVRRPICRIPTVAIHLNRGVNDDGLKLNSQTQLPAVFALDGHDLGDDPVRGFLAREIGCQPGDVLTWDLCLFDLAAPTQGGANGEFVFSARLDNLGSSHAAVEGLIAASEGPLPESTAVVALFDHEEVGSTTSRGATSRLLEGVLERVMRGTDGSADLFRAVGSSWHLSADMAHAVHPGFADKHEPQHMPQPNKGPVIKQNASQRYGTEAETAGLVVRLCEAHEIPYQWFVTRTDLACGTTVGPLVAAQLGIRTVDVGNPMLSMHSVREMCGSGDQKHMVRLMEAFLAGEG